MDRCLLVFGLVAALTSVACVEASLIACEDGRSCPVGTVCDEAHHGCVGPDQLAACADVAMFAACDAAPIGAGRCFDGVCLAAGCGNGFVEPEELCDDANQTNGDGCSIDCTSREVCGDGYVDAIHGEQCDDGNTRGRDGCTAQCMFEDFVWRRHGGEPSKREFAAMAYDSDRGTIVMFGGSDLPSTYLADTWQWDGASWAQHTPPLAPPPRHKHAMAYDPRRHVVVLFGGFATSLLNDTWEWNGVTWRRIRPMMSPPGRADHAMVWDGALGKIVMFGGDRFLGRVADTWTWDGETWTELAIQNPPLPRSSHAMTYDPVRGRSVLFGGQDGTTKYRDTWILDAGGWTQLATASSPPALDHAMADHDPERRLVTLHGRAAGKLATWELDDVTWRNVSPTTPPTLTTGFSGAFHIAQHRHVLWGGDSTNTSATRDALWEWNGMTWTQVAAQVRPSARSSAGLASDPIRGRVVLFGGVPVSAPPLADTWEWDGRAWTARLVVGPPRRAAPVMAYDGRGVVLFGGLDGTTTLGDTWTWDGQTWTSRATAGPPPRSFAASAYDPERDQVVVFGGRDDSTLYGDTWVWDGATWSQRVVTSAPSPRSATAMAYDAARGRIVLFGGQDETGPRSDTWEWDGTSWIEVIAPVLPDARYGHMLVFDRARQRTVLGAGLFLYWSQWEWDGTQWSQPPSGQEPTFAVSLAAVYDDARGEVLTFGGLGFFTALDLTTTGSFRGAGDEACEAGADLDGDGRIGCDDEDCAFTCAPACLTTTTCTLDPRCGDSACSVLESDRSCPIDCPPEAPVCGDGYCAANELCVGDCP